MSHHIPFLGNPQFMGPMMFYHVKEFKFLVTQGWNLGVIPVPFESLWLHLWWSQRDYIIKFRFAFTGKWHLDDEFCFCFSLPLPRTISGIFKFNSCCGESCLTVTVFAGMLHLDYVSVKRISGRVSRTGEFGALSCPHMRIDMSMSSLLAEYLVLFQLQSRKVWHSPLPIAWLFC